MKLFRFYFRLGFELLLFCGVVILIGLVAAQKLPYEGDLAYISTATGINTLYLMDVQRQFNIFLNNSFINDCCLTWSPDGRTLTYIRDVSEDGSTDIFSMNFHTPIKALTSAPGADLYPAYSPDGTQIAYTGYGFENPEIYLMNADGSQSHALTGTKRIVNLNPHAVWSADGQSILFSDFNAPGTLYAVPKTCADPCEDTIHTAYNTNGLPLMTTSFIPLDAARLFVAAFNKGQQGGYGMYSLDTQSSTPPEHLTVNSGLTSPAMAIYDHWIAFASGNTDIGQPVEDTNLYVLDSNCIGSEKGCAGSIQKITNQLNAEDDLSWSPDGHWLAFVTVANKATHLNLLDTTCVMQHQDCAASIHPLFIASSRYIRPEWRPPIH